MVVRFTATCVMNANPKTYKIVSLLPWIFVGLTMTNIDGGLVVKPKSNSTGMESKQRGKIY
jgi:hypothetical protein